MHPFPRVKPNVERLKHLRHKAVGQESFSFVVSKWSNTKGQYIKLSFKKHKMDLAHHTIEYNYIQISKELLDNAKNKKIKSSLEKLIT